MAPTSIRSVLGTVKDQTSIGLAKVSSNVSPTVDVLVVKATSHDDSPAEERHIREILSRTSYSLPHVAGCVAAISRRLTRTRDWVVALKALSLVHRLLADGNPAFQREVLHGTRRGARMLNMSDFRDEAHAHSWDQSAFVRAYAMYLDQRLECALYESKHKVDVGGGSEGGGDRRRRSYSYDRSYHSDDFRYDGGGSGGGGYDDRRRASSYDEPPVPKDERRRYHSNSPPARSTTTTDAADGESAALKPPTPTNVPPEQVLGKMYQLQQLLDRFLACRPTGRAKNTRMVLVALYPVLSESFLIYADLCKSLAAILDRFFDLEYRDCVKALDAYARAARQIDELVSLYAWCKDVGIARSSEYPEVKKITNELLDTLEEFVRDKAKAGSPTPAPQKPEPPVAAAEVEEEEVVVEDFNGIKALPAPEVVEEVVVEEKKPQLTGDLLDLREDVSTADDQGNRLALALFTGGGGAFSSANDDNSGVTSAWQTPAAEPGTADWELMLVETATNLPKQKPNLPGGFDPVLLDGMYDQGVVNQHVNSQVTGGSASSVALPLPNLGRNAKPVLALPAPDGTVQTVGHDPFAASLTVPPPSYVQMSDLEKKQQLLVQEQQVWQRYAMDGMQGQTSLAKLSTGYSYGPPPAAVPAYGMPPVNATGGGYYYTSY